MSIVIDFLRRDTFIDGTTIANDFNQFNLFIRSAHMRGKRVMLIAVPFSTAGAKLGHIISSYYDKTIKETWSPKIHLR